MTEIAIRQSDTVSLIQETAQNLQAALQIGSALANTIMVPAHFRGKPEECAAAILYGDTIGMDPVTSLQQIHVISGKPGLYARAMVAVVLAKGHEVWTVEAGPLKVIIEGKRKGSDKVERSEWTVDRARKAGYTSNKKYETDPESMLYARASGDVSRRVAPDALLGMAHSIEELELEENDSIEQVAARSAVSRLRSAVPASEPAAIEAPPAEAEIVEAETVPEPADEPVAEPEPAAAVEDVNPNTTSITADQRKKLGTLFKKNDLDETNARAYTAATVGRAVQSSAELTKFEAADLITALNSLDFSSASEATEAVVEEPPE